MSSPFLSPTDQIALGVHYFFRGWHLLFQRRFLPFVLIPILINIILMSGLIALFFYHIGDWLNFLLPDWLEWLNVVLIPLIFLLILVLFYFAFTTLANLIAAPFNAILAEKVEQHLSGEAVLDLPLSALLKDVPRMLKREVQKMLYSLPRLIALFLLGFMPVLGQTVVPLLVFLFSAWMLAIQYCDYPFDNHKIPFNQMRNALTQDRYMNFTFGALISLGTMIPVVNFLIMPVAVCGATAMWVSEYRSLFLPKAQ